MNSQQEQKFCNEGMKLGFRDGKEEGIKQGRSEAIKEILEMILKYNPSKSNMMYNEVVAELWTDLNAKLKEVKE